MILHVHTPRPPLDQWIESFIYYREFHADHMLDRLLPDGNVTLIIDLNEKPQHVYDNHTHAEIQTCRQYWLSGIRSRPITIPSGSDSEMLIVNFRKGKAYPFLREPLHVYSDLVVDADLALDRDIAFLRERVKSIPEPLEKFHYVEEYLLRIARARLEANPFVDYAVSFIMNTPHNTAISALSAKVGFSQKHMIDLFKTHLGMTPKAFLRVIRFQNVIREIESAGHPDWKTIAFDAGYYDHAHFIHDFRHFAGLSPGEYLSMKNETMNYVPVG